MPKKIPDRSKDFHPFCEMIGLEFTLMEKGVSQCRLKVHDRLLNPHKVVHGGAIYTMTDTGMGAAVYPYLDEDQLCATLEIKISYLKSVRSGLLVCDTKVIHKGKNVIFLESVVKNSDEQFVATATGTFYLFNPDKNS
jgi:acyl-CoA thioesterase